MSALRLEFDVQVGASSYTLLLRDEAVEVRDYTAHTTFTASWDGASLCDCTREEAGDGLYDALVEALRQKEAEVLGCHVRRVFGCEDGYVHRRELGTADVHLGDTAPLRGLKAHAALKVLTVCPDNLTRARRREVLAELLGCRA